jgi:group I intron endonuclease
VQAINTDLQKIAEAGIIQETGDGRWIVINFKKRNEPISNSERAKDFRMRNFGNSKTNDKIMGIYRITCLANGKTYIGSSIDCDRRISVHFSEANQESNWMHEDMNRYGKSGFETEIVEIVEDKKELPERETYWIKQYEPERLYNREFAGKQNAHRQNLERKENVNRTQRSQEEQSNRSTDLNTTTTPPLPPSEFERKIAGFCDIYAKQFGKQPKMDAGEPDKIIAMIQDGVTEEEFTVAIQEMDEKGFTCSGISSARNWIINNRSSKKRRPGNSSGRAKPDLGDYKISRLSEVVIE